MLKAAVIAAVPLMPRSGRRESSDQKPMTANGGNEPLPIPWLDKNGSHNQPAGPNQEPSHIYHFKARVARCSTFFGMRTVNKGNRIAFGSPTTDYGAMMADCWTARTTQHETFTHL